MLDRDHAGQSLPELIASLPCRVQLPEKWRKEFEKRGPAPTIPNDRRRHPRFYCRGPDSRAGLQCLKTFPSMPHHGDWHGIYVTNVSRSGVQLLHSEPLYPCQRARLAMPRGPVLQIEVVSCLRLNQRCFQVGARLLG
jgi:hypothetical protein